MSITSANSVFMVAVKDLFPVPIKLQGYSTDDAFMADAVVVTETLMGVDGKLSAGYVPNPTVITVTFQADSNSIALFEAVVQAMQAARDTYELSATIVIPGVSRAYACVTGFLTEYKPLPDAKKLLQPVTYKITFESVTVSAI